MLHNQITLEKHRILGFYLACIYSKAIDLAEMKRSIEGQLIICDDIEMLEIFSELVSFDGSKLELAKIIYNSSPNSHSPLSESQDDALTGIAYKRGVIPYEHTPALEQTAKRALEKHPEVEELFREVFPFIKF